MPDQTDPRWAPTLQDAIRLARHIPEAERARRIAIHTERLRAARDPRERLVEEFMVLLYSLADQARLPEDGMLH